MSSNDPDVAMTDPPADDGDADQQLDIDMDADEALARQLALEAQMEADAKLAREFQIGYNKLWSTRNEASDNASDVALAMALSVFPTNTVKVTQEHANEKYRRNMQGAPIFTLPNELLLDIGELIHHDHRQEYFPDHAPTNVNQIRKTCKFFSDLFTPLVYKHALKRKNYGQLTFNNSIHIRPETIMHNLACSSGSDVCRQMDEFIKLGAKVDVKNAEAVTPLQLCARWGSSDLLKHLIEAGADVNANPVNYPTPLLNAIAGRRIDQVQLLLAYGVDVRRPENLNPDSTLRLPNAVDDLVAYYYDVTDDLSRGEIFSILDRFFEAGANTGMKALGTAVYNEDYHLTQQLLIYGAKPDQMFYNPSPSEMHVDTFMTVKGQNNWHCGRPLQLAIMLHNEPIARLLIEHGAKLRPTNAVAGSLPPALHIAVKDSRPDLIQVLLSAGADIECNHHGNTALMLAVKENNVDIAQLLLNAGANVNGANSGGETALHVAVRAENMNAIDMLAKAGVNVNAGYDVQFNGRASMAEHELDKTALGIAVRLHYVEIVKKLLEMGADGDLRTNEKAPTMLIAFIWYYYVSVQDGTCTDSEAFSLLLERSDANAIWKRHGHEHYTSLGVAVQKRDVPLLEALLARGAKVEKDPQANLAWIVKHYHNRHYEESDSDTDSDDEGEEDDDDSSIEGNVSDDGEPQLSDEAAEYRKRETEIVEMLLKAGLDPLRKKHEDDKSPLELAGAKGKSGLVDVMTRAVAASVNENGEEEVVMA